MVPYVIGLSGSLTGQRFMFDNGVLSFGRDHRRTVVLTSQLVSRLHADIRSEARGYFLSDHGSRNGTCVNGMRISTWLLTSGDTIAIGGERFQFHAADQDETLVPYPTLTGLQGRLAGQRFVLHENVLSIGRSPACTIVIDSKQVSRTHAEIHPTPHGYMVRDQNSQNGTFVNQTRVQEQLLSPGDTIGIGDELFAFAGATSHDDTTLVPLPTGTVTFLFTDVEGSTRIWEQAPAAMRQALVRHDRLIEGVVAQHNGIIVRPRGEGDSRFAVFAQPTDAVIAAAAIQHALGIELWPTPTPLRVRIALHTGEADLREGDYYGVDVNRCARLRSLAKGGQTLVSSITALLTRDQLPIDLCLDYLGEHVLKDLLRAEHVFQLVSLNSASPSELLHCERDSPQRSEWLPMPILHGGSAISIGAGYERPTSPSQAARW